MDEPGDVTLTMLLFYIYNKIVFQGSFLLFSKLITNYLLKTVDTCIH
jgi:hypothetical protein